MRGDSSALLRFTKLPGRVTAKCAEDRKSNKEKLINDDEY